MSKGKYSLCSIAVCKKNSAHLPYIAYGIVEGPRGGQILIDYYNLEKIFKSNRFYSDMSIEPLLISYANKNDMLDAYKEIDTSDGGLRSLATKNGLRALIRNQNTELTRKVADDISCINLLS
jgi:hypothetical protein